MEYDWADEIALKLFDDFCTSDEITKPTAAELRAAELRGRARGMREAAEIAEREELHCLEAAKTGDTYMNGSHGAAQSIKNEIRELASKLSPT